MVKKEWVLDFAYPTLGSKRVSEIRPLAVLKVVQEIEFKGNYETARRLKSTIGQVCRYAVATSRAEFDPTPVLQGAITPRFNEAMVFERQQSDEATLFLELSDIEGPATENLRNRLA
jgi:hypothetical protein